MNLAARSLVPALAAVLTALTLAAAPSEPAALTPLPLAEQMSVSGGGCLTGCEDEGSSSSGAVGSPYWQQTGRSLLSRGHSGAELGSKFNNYSDQTVTKTFSYTRRVVRSVEFSGGWADAFTVKIGGEIDESTTDSVRYDIPPWHTGKLYYKHWTERYQVYGTKYQDYSDGSREVLDRDDGPYRTTFTETSYVTSSLR